MADVDHAAQPSPALAETCEAPPAVRTPTAKDLWDDIMDSIKASNPTALSAQVAYSLIFALPSILLAVMAIAVQIDGHFNFQITDSIKEAINRQAPEQLRPVLDSLIDGAIQRAHEFVPTVSAIATSLVALAIAGGGFQSMAYACAQAGGVKDERPYWLRRLMGALSVLLLSVMLVLGFLLFLFGESISRLLGQVTGGEDQASTIWTILRQPLSLLLVFGALVLMYRFGAGMQHQWRWFLPGAAAATIIWVALLKGFQIYLNVSNPGSAYGAASSVLLLLVFFYLTSLVLIGGAMASAVLGRRYDAPRDGTA